MFFAQLAQAPRERELDFDKFGLSRSQTEQISSITNSPPCILELSSLGFLHISSLSQ